MPPKFHLQIMTPQGITYTGDVIHTLIPAEDGYVGILANHASYVTSSPGGFLQIREREFQEKKFQVGPGFFTVSENQASFLTQSFQAEEETPT
jgi:F-type H+-transporting ATPase subunit epsilon